MIETPNKGANTQKLREVIESYGSALGSTEEGKAWCIKALHPSDPLTEVRGVPDQSTASTVFLNMQQQVEITGPAGPWNLDLDLLTDPSVPLTYYKALSAGGSAAAVSVPNSQFGVDMTHAAEAWATAFQEWRVAFMGASVYLNASDLYNEGTCTAAQYSLKPRLMSAIVGGTAGEVDITQICIQDFVVDDPSYANLVRMPNAYTGEAREGCYMPLKLDSNHAKWHDENDLSYSLGVDSTATTVTLPTTAEDRFPFPYYGRAAWASTDAPMGVAGKCSIVGDVHLLPCSSLAGRISLRGLNQLAKVNVVLRYGFECRVQPDSAYSSFQALSCPYDMVAVNTYFQIARQLKDAYPVSYNDFGKLWDVIKSVARTVDPFLGLIPGGDIIRHVGKGIGGVIDMVRTPAKPAPPAAKGPPDGPSVYQLEAASKRASDAMARQEQSQMRTPRSSASKKSRKARKRRSLGGG